MNRRVVALGAAAGEQHFSGRFAADECCDMFACFFDLRLQVRTKTVGAGRISPLLMEIRQHGLAHLRQDWRGGVVVEVDHKDSLAQEASLGQCNHLE